MIERVEIKTLRPRERCVINGHVCEIVRQARRTTFVRIVESADSDIVGAVVQLERTKTVTASQAVPA